MVKWTPFLLYFLWSATNKVNKRQDYTVLMEINLGVPLLQRTRRYKRSKLLQEPPTHSLLMGKKKCEDRHICNIELLLRQSWRDSEAGGSQITMEESRNPAMIFPSLHQRMTYSFVPRSRFKEHCKPNYAPCFLKCCLLNYSMGGKAVQ